MPAREKGLKEFHFDNAVDSLCALVWAFQSEPGLSKMTGTKHTITRKCPIRYLSVFKLRLFSKAEVPLGVFIKRRIGRWEFP